MIIAFVLGICLSSGQVYYDFSNQRAEIEAEVVRMEKIETATEPKFQDYFIAAMAIPHQRDAFPNLSKVVALPKRHGATDVATGKRRRRAASRRSV
jgi:uncharacterized 2Fe-2S/4Fe-4S cluster protein (DUF4445 family)